MFAQTAPFDKDEIKEEEPTAAPKTIVPVPDDSSENSSRRSEKMTQNLSPFSISSKKTSSLAVQETEDDGDIDLCCEEFLLCDDDDDIIEEEEEDTTTRELKAKLFMISQRLNEAETKLHRVLQNTK